MEFVAPPERKVLLVVVITEVLLGNDTLAIEAATEGGKGD